MGLGVSWLTQECHLPATTPTLFMSILAGAPQWSTLSGEKGKSHLREGKEFTCFS